MFPRSVVRTASTAAAVLAASFISAAVQAQIPPISPASGICPAPPARGAGAGGGGGAAAAAAGRAGAGGAAAAGAAGGATAGRGAATAAATPAPDPKPAFPGPVFDQTAPPGANYENAAFRLWIPQQARTVRAVLVLTPGSNGDGRNQVMDSTWERYAIENNLALVGTSFQDKAPRGIFENYIDVAKGSGDAFLTAMRNFAQESGHPELATAPFLLWGMSAGGEFNFEMTLWKPERVVAFIVNKGGIYWHALATPEARAVPGILFVGGQDLDSRIGTIFGLFALNRRGGALWAFSAEPCAGHIVGKSQALAMMFYADMLSARLNGAGTNPDGTPKLTTLSEGSGLIGNISDFTYGPAGDRANTNLSTSWLPNDRIARGWQAIAMGKAMGP